MRGVVASLIALGASACYSPSYEDCAISCVNNGCPSGLECRAGSCRTANASGDCPVIDNDGGVDTNDDAPQSAGWSTPVKVPLSLSGVFDPSLTPDMLQLFVMQSNMIYFSVRPTASSQWPALTVVSVSNLPGIKDQTPSISSDGLTLFFNSDRNGASAGQDIFMAKRPDTSSPWGSPVPVTTLNSAVDDSGENMSFDMKTMVFASTRANNMLDIYTASRVDITTPSWSGPVPIPALNVTSFNDAHPFLSRDQLTIYFQSNRNGSTDLFTAHRTTPTGTFDPPMPITEIDTMQFSEGDPWVSPDERHMFFSSNREGTSAIYETTR